VTTNSTFRSLTELQEDFQASAVTTNSTFRSLTELQEDFQATVRRNQMTLATKTTVLRSLSDLQKDFQPSLHKMQNIVTTEKSALRSLADLQKDFQQKQTKGLSAKAEPFCPSEYSENPGDVSLAHELPCLLGHAMPESLMTDVMLAVLHDKLQDEKTPKTVAQKKLQEVSGSISIASSVSPMYSRNVLLGAFRALSDANYLAKENPGLPSVQCMPRLQRQSRRKPRQNKQVISKEDPCLPTAQKIISLPIFGDCANGDLKFDKASGDSTPTAAGDTASDSFSEF